MMNNGKLSFMLHCQSVCVGGGRMDFTSTCLKAFDDLIRPCWEADPKKRPTSQQILLRLDAMMNNGKLSLMLHCKRVCVGGEMGAPLRMGGLYKHLFESI